MTNEQAINSFWNSVGAQQIRSGGAPSVRTKEIKEYESGKRTLSSVSEHVNEKGEYDHESYIKEHSKC